MNGPIHSSLISDPDYWELVSEFVSNVPDRVHMIRKSIEERDTKQLCTLIHQLKGACGSYGFHEVTPLAASLEGEIRKGTDIALLVDSIEAFIQMCLRMSASPDERQ